VPATTSAARRKKGEAKGVAVVACMDARLDVHKILGLSEGDAHVIRNAGGVVWDAWKGTDWLPGPWRDGERKRTMYARVTNIRFPPEMEAEVTSVAQGLAPILRRQRGFEGLQVLTDPNAGEGIITCFWETEDEAEASEATSSYIGQMSMMSSFLHEPLVPKTYEVSVKV
jgi:heme-degrading monooxygenase HmoA